MSNTPDTTTLVVTPATVTPHSMVTAFGTTRSARQWASEPICMVSEKTLVGRLNLGWPLEVAIVAPLRTPLRHRGSRSGQLRSETVEFMMEVAWIAWRNWGDGRNASTSEATDTQAEPDLLTATAVIAEHYSLKSAHEDAARWLEDNAIQAVADIAANGLPDATPMLLELRVHSLPFVFE